MACRVMFACVVLTSCFIAMPAAAAPMTQPARFENGLPTDDSFFPIAVWLQDPRQAQRYKEAGMNIYVGLWKGPTEEQLAALKKAGMMVICDQNQVGLKHKADKTIVGWMHGDEPDNAQSLGPGKGYGPPVDPAKIVAQYRQIRQNDPARPVVLNLGQGVAWDGWYGRGVRTRHPEDYAQYVKGCDIASFDIYPVTHNKAEVAGKLWYVAQGVDRLRKWSDGRPVWNCIECTRINAERGPTPHQVKAEVWMSLIHGSSGLIYFVHEWKPRFNEHALLDNPDMLTAVTRINAQIRELSAVLHSPTIADAARVQTERDKPVDILVKRHGGAAWIFSVAMSGEKSRARFQVPGMAGGVAEVLGEGRQVKINGGQFEDEFAGWDVHLYRVK